MDDHGQRWLEDFRPGERFEGEARRLDEEAFAGFARLTGDAHPIHYDEDYARQTKFGARLAHGLLLASVCALGATRLSASLRDSMVAFVEQGMRYRRPVRIGETVRPAFVVERIDVDKERIRFNVTLQNTGGEIVAEGFHEYALRRRPA